MADSNQDYQEDVMTRARSEYINDLPPFIQENMDCCWGYRIRAFRKSRNNSRPRAWRRELTCRQWDGVHKFWTYTEKGVRSIVKAFHHSWTEVAFYEWIGGAADGNPWNQWRQKPISYLPRLCVEFETAFDSLEGFLKVPKKPRGPYRTRTRAENELETAQADAIKHEPLEEMVQAAGGGTDDNGHVEASLQATDTDDSDEEPLLRSLHRQQADSLVPAHIRASSFHSSGTGVTCQSSQAFSPSPADSLLPPTSTRMTPPTPASVSEVYSAPIQTTGDDFLSSATNAQDQGVTDTLSHERVSASTEQTGIHDTVPDGAPVPALHTQESLFEEVSGTPNTSSSPPAVPAASIAKDSQDNIQPAKMTSVMMNHTTFHISLSTNTFDAVPVKLSSCPTIALFYASIAASWNISEAETEAVSVHFGWLDGTEALVVKREVPDIYLELLETIEDAPCWTDGWMGRRKCSIKVIVHMKEAPVKSEQRKRKDREVDAGDDKGVGLRRRVIKLE